MSNITRQQLINLLDQLALSQESWNQAVVSEDRGPNNNALCIILYDDGSGVIADFWGSAEKFPDEINVQHNFDTVEEAADYLIEYHQALENEDL